MTGNFDGVHISPSVIFLVILFQHEPPKINLGLQPLIYPVRRDDE
jgi:hypothetical protein